MRGFANHPYIPNSDPKIQEAMLQELGMTSLDELHHDIPDSIKLDRELNLPEAFDSEYALQRHVAGLLKTNTTCKDYLNFLGAGCWQHYVPALCADLTGFLAAAWAVRLCFG